MYKKLFLYNMPIISVSTPAFSSTMELESPTLNTLPPFVCFNPREKIIAEKIDMDELIPQEEQRKGRAKGHSFPQPCASLEIPEPLHPLTITWSPDVMYFEINEEVVEQKLWVWNTCNYTIYIHCCDFWGEAAYFGAKWRFSNQTRFHLAPGLKGEMLIRATPKEDSTVPCANACLQIAAAHKRDIVTGFFAVPVFVKFNNFVAYTGEGG